MIIVKKAKGSTLWLNDIDTMQHVDKLKLIISRESPKWVLCDAGYGKTKNQILMRAYPGKVWSVFTSSGSNMPIWNTVRELDKNPLPEEDWQYHVSINHTAMCENTENIAARRNLGICYFPEQQARMDVLLYEISQSILPLESSAGSTSVQPMDLLHCLMLYCPMLLCRTILRTTWAAML